MSRRSSTRSCSPSPVTSQRRRRRPARSGRSSPPTRLSSVVLPAPERPRSATSSPARDVEVDAAHRVDRRRRPAGRSCAGRGPRPSAQRSSASVRRGRSGQISTWSSPSSSRTRCRSAERLDERRAAAAAGRPGPAPRTPRRPRCSPSVAARVRRTSRWRCGRRGSRPCGDLRRDTSGRGSPRRRSRRSSRLTVRSAPNTSCAVTLSSSPVGSSANSTSRLVGQRHRDRDPLLLAAGHLAGPPVGAVGDARPARAARSRARRARVRPVPARRIGSSTFSARVRYGTRLRAVCCHTNPTMRRRYEPPFAPDMVSRSWPATRRGRRSGRRARTGC